MANKNPQIFDNIFGNSTAAVKEMLNKTDKKAQVAWSQAIQTNVNILPEWKDRFTKLGATKEFQNIEINAIKSLYNRAVSLLSVYQVKSERAVALFFDILTQNGSISDVTKLDILQTFVKQNIKDEVQKLTVIAIKRAEASNPRWIEDVKKRKLAIANGQGIVHGSNINLEKDFFITLNNII